MAFSLGLSSCQNGNCKTLTLTDTSTTWNGIGMPLMSDTTSATLEISTSSNTSVSFILDVTSYFLYENVGLANGVLGGTIITGSGTTWISNITPNDTITFNGLTNTYVITSVDSDTQLTLATPLTVAITNDYIFNVSSPSSLPINLVYEIISDDIGLSTNLALPDDVYNIIYTVINDGTTYIYETNQLLYCAVECCVQHKVQQIPQYYGCSTCDSTHILDALLSYSFLIALESAARCGSADELTNILNTLKKLCNYQPCIGCK